MSMMMMMMTRTTMTVNRGSRTKDNDNGNMQEDQSQSSEKEDDDADLCRHRNSESQSIFDRTTAIRIQKMQEEIKMLQQTNTKMKRIIKKKKYDEAEGEFVSRKLVAMQKTTIIKYVKNQIFPHVKSACNELLFSKPAILEKCYNHLQIRSTADQQAVRDDVCGLIKYSLCQKRKYVKERLRAAFSGKFRFLLMVGIANLQNKHSHICHNVGSKIYTVELGTLAILNIFLWTELCLTARPAKMKNLWMKFFGLSRRLSLRLIVIGARI